MSKGKYEYWLSPEGLLSLEGWARDGLTDKQIAKKAGMLFGKLNDTFSVTLNATVLC